MWQYSSKGKVNGISGNVDMNWCYVDYVKKEAPKPVEKPAETPKPTVPATKPATKTYYGKNGDKITLENVNFYAASSSTTLSGKPRTGVFYIWNNEVVNGKIRITTQKDFVGVANKVTAWISISQIGKTPVTTPKPTTPAKPAEKKYAVGDAVVLKKGKLYVSSTGKTALTKTKTYYIYDGKKVNGRYRVTNNKKNCNKKPLALYVSGWVEV
jgi:hypothetical protein